MTHETLIQIVCASHIAILGSAFTILIKFSSLSSGFRSWRIDIEGILNNVKRDLAVSLGEKLRPILNSATTTTNILGVEGDYYEKPVSPTEGEEYRNTLFNFINDKANEMARYRSLLLAHKAYSFWGTYLSIAIVTLMVVEFFILAITGYFGVLEAKTISKTLLITPFTISGIGIIICFVGLVFFLISHHRGINARGCND